MCMLTINNYQLPYPDPPYLLFTSVGRGQVGLWPYLKSGRLGQGNVCIWSSLAPLDFGSNVNRTKTS